MLFFVIYEYTLSWIKIIILQYNFISEVWDQVGTKEKDNTLVLRKTNPPFKDVATGQIKGNPDLIYLMDKTCNECYNVSIHKSILVSNFGMTFDTEKYVDVSSKEGKQLIMKYSIEKAPTIIISKDAQEYPNFETIWKEAGDTAKDGNYVFRNLDLLQGMAYKDLKSGNILNATGQAK